MDKQGNITISYDTWKKGIQSPLIGMGDMVNVDIFDKPGVLKIDYAPTVLSTANIDTPFITPIYFPGTSTLDLFSQGGERYLYSISSGNATASTAGDSTLRKATYWAGRGIILDAINSSTINLDATNTVAGASIDQDDWESLTGLTNAQDYNAIHASPADNDLYIGGGRHIARISQAGTFDPSSGATWTTIEKFLTLPNNYVVRDITTLSNFLVVSASVLGDAAGNISGSPFGARLYYWDMGQTATAAVEWSGFVDLSTDVASPIIPVNNTIQYFSWGTQTWGTTNLSATADTIQFNNFNGILEGNEDCVDLSKRSIVLGLSSTGTDSPAGIYKILDNAYTRSTLSNDEVGANGAVTINNVYSVIGNDYLVGWTFDGGYGIDHFGKNNYRYTGYRAYIESPLYGVSGSLKKRSYQQVEVSLAKELSTGQGIKVYYRKNLTDDWTLMQTFDFSTYGAKAQFNGTAKITDASTLQIKVELTTGSSSTTTPELISVRLF